MKNWTVALLLSLAALTGCGPAHTEVRHTLANDGHEDPPDFPDDPDSYGDNSTAPTGNLVSNGGFEDPHYIPPPTIDIDGNIILHHPNNIPTGWTVDAAPPWPSGHPRNAWHLGINARYGEGRLPAPPDPLLPDVPNGTAVFTPGCRVWEAGLCDYPFYVRSSPFPATGGTSYTASLWFRTFAYSPYPGTVTGIQLGVEWLTATGTSLGTAWAVVTPSSVPQDAWEQFQFTSTAPAGTAQARAVLRINKLYRDVYVDDVAAVQSQ